MTEFFKRPVDTTIRGVASFIRQQVADRHGVSPASVSVELVGGRWHASYAVCDVDVVATLTFVTRPER